jgi:hypothetical protein
MGNSPTFLGKHVGCEDQLYALLGVSDDPPSPVTKQTVQTAITPKWRNVLWVDLVDMAELLEVAEISKNTTHDQLVVRIAGLWVDKVAAHRIKPKFEPGDEVRFKSGLSAYVNNSSERMRVVSCTPGVVVIESYRSFTVPAQVIEKRNIF